MDQVARPLWRILMWAFFISPLGRKIALYGVATVTIFLVIRWWGNKQYYQGREAESMKATENLDKRVQEATQRVRDELKMEWAELESSQQQLNAERAQFKRDQARIDQVSNERMAKIESLLKEDNRRVITTNDSDLPDLIRALNAEPVSYTHLRAHE